MSIKRAFYSQEVGYSDVFGGDIGDIENEHGFPIRPDGIDATHT